MTKATGAGEIVWVLSASSRMTESFNEGNRYGAASL